MIAKYELPKQIPISRFTVRFPSANDDHLHFSKNSKKHMEKLGFWAHSVDGHEAHATDWEATEYSPGKHLLLKNCPWG